MRPLREGTDPACPSVTGAGHWPSGPRTIRIRKAQGWLQAPLGSLVTREVVLSAVQGERVGGVWPAS